MAQMSPTTAELVVTLNRLGTRRTSPILASMYRHLAHWPSYLALAWTLIAPLEADGRLARSIDDAATKARARAARVAVRLGDLSALAPAPDVAVAIRAAIEPFAGDVIVKMVVICALLRAATGRDEG